MTHGLDITRFRAAATCRPVFKGSYPRGERTQSRPDRPSGPRPSGSRRLVVLQFLCGFAIRERGPRVLRLTGNFGETYAPATPEAILNAVLDVQHRDRAVEMIVWDRLKRLSLLWACRLR